MNILRNGEIVFIFVGAILLFVGLFLMRCGVLKGGIWVYPYAVDGMYSLLFGFLLSAFGVFLMIDNRFFAKTQAR